MMARASVSARGTHIARKTRFVVRRDVARFAARRSKTSVNMKGKLTPLTQHTVPLLARYMVLVLSIVLEIKMAFILRDRIIKCLQ
jgi:hypothetical protein